MPQSFLLVTGLVPGEGRGPERGFDVATVFAVEVGEGEALAELAAAAVLPTTAEDATLGEG
ncbi:MAG: hypothetical protein HUU21_39070, partial [Polyangiaceae bacterium]|nr:hypothetical protein [Polyangiaceae bacterium]